MVWDGSWISIGSSLATKQLSMERIHHSWQIGTSCVTDQEWDHCISTAAAHAQLYNISDMFMPADDGFRSGGRFMYTLAYKIQTAYVLVDPWDVLAASKAHDVDLTVSPGTLRFLKLSAFFHLKFWRTSYSHRFTPKAASSIQRGSNNVFAWTALACESACATRDVVLQGSFWFNFLVLRRCPDPTETWNSRVT